MKNNYIETDLSKIKHLSSIRENENIRFRTFLKGKDGAKVDSIVHRLHEEISKQIDCGLCGNCCNMRPRLYKEDIEVLSRLENITPESYEQNYCEPADFNEIYLKSMPCRYLEGTKCSIQENRPKQCRDFPYTNKEGFTSRLLGMLGFYEICPIVFNLMERLKDEMQFRR